MTAVGQATMDRVILAVAEKPGQTASELGVSSAVANALRASTVLRKVSSRPHVNPDGSNRRGRPSFEYGLGAKGQGRKRTLLREQAKAAEPVAA